MGNTADSISSTVTDVVANKKTYYDCPRCGREVWAYGALVGSVCIDCPGPPDADSKDDNKESAPTMESLISNIAPTIVNAVQASNEANGNEASFRGDVMWRIKGGDDSDPIITCLSNSDREEKIMSVTTKSIGILLAIADNTGIDHWWMNIETDKSYYQIQFHGNSSSIKLRKCDSISDCDESGLAEANRASNLQPTIQNNYSCNSLSGSKTLGNLVDWLEDGGVSSDYHLLNNNCQHLCKKYMVGFKETYTVCVNTKIYTLIN